MASTPALAIEGPAGPCIPGIPCGPLGPVAPRRPGRSALLFGTSRRLVAIALSVSRSWLLLAGLHRPPMGARATALLEGCGAAPDRLFQTDGARLLTDRPAQGHFNLQTVRQASTLSGGSALGSERHALPAAVG